MTMNGSFAGGLADGLRNGMAIAQAYDMSKDRQRAREEADRKKRAEGEIAAAMAGGDSIPEAPAGLERIQVPGSVAAGPAVGDVDGLQPVPINAPMMPNSGLGPDPSTVNLADFAPGAQWGDGSGVRQSASPLAAAAEKKRFIEYYRGRLRGFSGRSTPDRGSRKRGA